MAKIPDMTGASELTGAEQIEVVQTGATRRTTAQDVAGLTVVNTDGDPGTTIYVGSVDPDVAYAPVDGDVWIEPEEEGS
jgi:hypothetical protein